MHLPLSEPVSFCFAILISSEGGETISQPESPHLPTHSSHAHSSPGLAEAGNPELHPGLFHTG